jgi:hypothetical protein
VLAGEGKKAEYENLFEGMLRDATQFNTLLKNKRVEHRQDFRNAVQLEQESFVDQFQAGEVPLPPPIKKPTGLNHNNFIHSSYIANPEFFNFMNNLTLRQKGLGVPLEMQTMRP